MSRRGSAPSLSLATLNPNGLNGPVKRRAVFKDFQDRRDGVDMLCVEETHCPSEAVAGEWLREGAGPGLPFRGPSAWAFGTSTSRGVAILVSPQVRLDSFESVYRCPHGRIVGVHFTLASRSYLVFCVYAPAEGGERDAFFSGSLRDALLAAVQQHPTAQLLVAGDFNCIESVTLDQVGDTNSAGRTVGFAGGLQPVQQEFGLIDAFRTLHPARRDFTHLATSRRSAARLDRVLVQDRLAPHLTAAGIADGWEGDHRLAFASFTLPSALPQGPGDWVFPAELLVEPQFDTTMTSTFQAWFLQHPVTPARSHAQRWEAFKLFARDRIRLYELRRSERLRQQHRQLQRQAAQAARAWAQRPDDARALNAWAAAQQALQQARTRAAQRAATYAGVLWEDWGESSTAWFHRLAEQRRSDSTIATLEVPSQGGGAATVSLADDNGRRTAGDCIADFYDGALPAGLFHPRPTDPSAQQLLLGSIDHQLPQAAQQQCEGRTNGIDIDELDAALKSCGRGKVPGSDGLTYEFYRAFWGVVGEPLADVFCEAFSAGGSGRLPDSMLLGIIVLVYKGAKAGPRTSVACYRPLTMLNCDYKILAKAIANRFGPALNFVIDRTQTAFLPKRWIGDNVLQHLEEIDYLEATRQPGVIAFLDFEKAYDAISRPWVFQCMQGLGFGPRAIQWVRLLLNGTRACCRFNGFHSREFGVLCGVAQGSPLSPALYIIAAQPLASRLRQLQCTGVIAGVALPDGSSAPPSHQHADDTTIHVPSLSDLTAAWQHAVNPFCAASASRANAAKTKAMLLGSAVDGHGSGYRHAATGVQVVAKDEAIRHLGIMLAPGAAGDEARAAKFAAIEQAVMRRVSHWSAHTLTHDGRAHLAQQVMASMFVYHATFTRPPPNTVLRIHKRLMQFVDGQDTLGGPCRAVLHLPFPLGGRGVPCLPRIIDALQPGIVCRLLHPARVPWKALAAHWWRSLPAPFAGLRSILSAGSPAAPLPPRVAAYAEGFRACMPHRLSPLDTLPAHHRMLEPLFGNPSVLSAQHLPLSPHPFPAAVAAGLHTVGDLATVGTQQPSLPASALTEAAQLRASLPSLLACTAVNPPQEDEHKWWERPAPATQPGPGALPGEVLHVLGGSRAAVYRVELDGSLTAVGEIAWPLPTGQPRARPCLAVRDPTTAPSQPPPGSAAVIGAPSGSNPAGQQDSGQLFYVGPWAAGAQAPVDPTRWGLAGTPLMVSSTKQRTRALLERDAAASDAASAAGYVVGQPIRPSVWPTGRGTPTPLASAEERWTALAAPPPRSRRPAEQTQQADPELAATAAWMRARIDRLSPQQRRQHRLDQQQLEPEGQEQRQLPQRLKWWSVFDDAEGGVPTPPKPPWRKAWRRLRRTSAPRVHRFLAWRVLHAALPPAARLAAWRRSTGRALGRAHGPCCHHPACTTAGSLETISHVFIDCPVARRVRDWACALFHAVWQRRPPPSADGTAVWLAGDFREWDPGGDGAVLWSILRLAVLHYLWTARCQGRQDGQPRSARTIIAQLVHYLRGCMVDDAIRAFSPLHEYAITGGEWLPDRPTLDPSGFHTRWAYRGVLCTHTGSTLHIHLTLTHPLPLPPP